MRSHAAGRRTACKQHTLTLHRSVINVSGQPLRDSQLCRQRSAAKCLCISPSGLPLTHSHRMQCITVARRDVLATPANTAGARARHVRRCDVCGLTRAEKRHERCSRVPTCCSGLPLTANPICSGCPLVDRRHGSDPSPNGPITHDTRIYTLLHANYTHRLGRLGNCTDACKTRVNACKCV